MNGIGSGGRPGLLVNDYSTNLQLRDSAGLDRLRRYRSLHPGNEHLSHADYSVDKIIARSFRNVKTASRASFERDEMKPFVETSEEAENRCADKEK